MGGRELLALMKRLSAAERTLSVYSLLQLAEVQRRKLHIDAGFPTMFSYCVGELGYSEGNAFRRLQAVDAARKFPEVISLVKEGAITICSLSVIARHLTAENSARVLKMAEGKSVRAVERIAAELAPRADTHDVIRTVPPTTFGIPIVSGTSVMSSAESPDPVAATPVFAIVPGPAFRKPESRQKVTPLSSDRTLFSFTGSEELRVVVERCKDLLWHRYPEGRLEDVFLVLGKFYLEKHDPELLSPSKPKPGRQIETRVSARWVRSAVYRRDGGRCTYVSQEGRRCEARRGLEYDHIVPWAKGGVSDDPSNIRLLCRAHNQRAAEAAGLT